MMMFDLIITLPFESPVFYVCEYVKIISTLLKVVPFIFWNRYCGSTLVLQCQKGATSFPDQGLYEYDRIRVSLFVFIAFSCFRFIELY